MLLHRVTGYKQEPATCVWGWLCIKIIYFIMKLNKKKEISIELVNSK